MINYLSEIITQDINKYKSFNSITQNENDKCDDYIHPCTTRPLDTNENILHELFDNDVCKLLNICNCHVYNLACYKSNIDASKKLCRYGFPWPLINTIHFDNDIGLLHIFKNYKWLNHVNPWILFTFKYNHDLKFIATSNKNNKSLIYYIIDYITKTSTYITHMYFLLQIVVQKIETMNKNKNSYGQINKSCHLFIQCLNPIGSQQEISTIKAISYLLNLLDHITIYDCTYILWYNLLTWVNE
jgi:hypothetical protein